MQFIPSGLSQNVAWTVNQSSYLIHIFIVGIFLFIFSRFFTTDRSIQLTIICYNFSTFLFFHWILNDPFDISYYGYTFWEQVVEQLEDSQGTLFLSIFPLILFILGSHLIIRWTVSMYILCLGSLFMVLIPKMGFMHRRRIFGLRKRY